MQESPHHLCVETDLSSAYQHASREEMLVRLLFATDELHDFLPIFYSLYDGDAELFFGDICSIFSEEGSHQGCPLGGFLFLLSILVPVETVISEFPTVTVVGLADDYRFVGPALDALAAAERYAELVSRSGHIFCVPKSIHDMHSMEHYYYKLVPAPTQVAQTHVGRCRSSRPKSSQRLKQSGPSLCPAH